MNPRLRALLHGLDPEDERHVGPVLGKIRRHAGTRRFHRNIAIEWCEWLPSVASRAQMTRILAWLGTVKGGAHLRQAGNRGKLHYYELTPPAVLPPPAHQMPPSEADYMHALERRPE